ncbi:DUF4878 domain-containing protein [Segatella paludivivens]|uniref:DUF4878 domain-containing protein n=1 Tax=Segatella paludivivens TaxID=185294 RepID=UPI000369793A|nr:DUF4878 domain-containing protein [Segatella paludivivens]
MKKIFYILLLVTVLFSCSSQKKDPSEIVGKTAKIYYDYLLNGDYEAFVDGMNQPDRIPDNYREQLVANAKMFVGQQNEDHKGIKKIAVSNAEIDTIHNTGDAYLLLTYGDKTTEQVAVPMVKRKGIWYMR